VIDKFFVDRVDKPAVIVKPEVKEEAAPSPVIETHLLDLDMLESYVDIVGVKPVYDSIKMFEDMMPDYIEVLDSNMTAKDQDGIVSEAHKIKGAAGSIGLKRIQSVAQKAQAPDMPAWWENISDWVEEIKNEYQNDIQVLKSWLDQRK
ncbi:Hpt domain-containing protein, partial [Escherichia coli]|nr:Hpt domain-containing protein [Escherichia coli]